ncbi:HesB/YadR/YfhF family protein [Microbacteriaceae bacterium 4G12]
MNLSISNEAAAWYKEEMLLQQGDAIRFFIQYGGCSTVQKGFSLGIRKDTPMNPIVQVEVQGITFFIEEDDVWYFDGHNLSVSYTSGEEEPQFHYEK